MVHYEHSECEKRADRDNRLADESFIEAYNRNLVFLYYKWKKLARPDKKYTLSPSERTEFLNEYKKIVNEEIEKIITTLFGMTEDNFNKELRAFEYNDGFRILDQNTERQRCATSMAGDFGRLHSIIKKEIRDKRQFQYWMDAETFICSTTKDTKDPNCITITNNLENYTESKNGHSQNYILVDSKYIPRNTDSLKTLVTIDVKYDKLPVISFIMDAFLNNGVLEIEPELEKRMRRDYIELFYLNPAEIAKLKVKVNLAIQKKIPKNINATKNELQRAMQIAKNAQNIKGYKAAPASTANNIEIREGNSTEVRLRKRIGTIRKKITNAKAIVGALKRGGRRTRKSRK
jgi:hypothetical protein